MTIKGKDSVTVRVIRKSTKTSASKVYVPKKLRAHVKTQTTPSGTRLVGKEVERIS